MRLDRPERPDPESPSRPTGPTRPNGPTDPGPPPDATALRACEEISARGEGGIRASLARHGDAGVAGPTSRSRNAARGDAGPPGVGPEISSQALTAARELGRALLWGGEAARALEVLAPVHRARPWDREVQHLMLDALSALGRAAGDFAWTLEPEVVPLDPPLLDELAVVLTANGGPATVLDLMLAVAERGYAAFTPRQLAAALDADRRFRVHRPGLAPECAVVARSPLPARPSRACAGK